MRGLIALEGGLRQDLPFKALQCNWKVNRPYLYRNIILKKQQALFGLSHTEVKCGCSHLAFPFFFLLVYPLCSTAATSLPCLFFVAYAPNWEHYSWRLDINLAASCNIESVDGGRGERGEGTIFPSWSKALVQPECGHTLSPFCLAWKMNSCSIPCLMSG